MTDWGIPDWRDPQAYGITKGWTMPRWRWEFLRRRKDVRGFYLEHAADAYSGMLERIEHRKANGLARLTDDIANVARPTDAGFSIWLNPADRKRFGMTHLPNPAIGDQRWDALACLIGDGSLSFAFGSWEGVSRLKVAKDQVGIAFSIEAPLELQLEHAKRRLQEAQRETCGKVIQKRRFPSRWTFYLRALDGREAKASWSTIADALWEKSPRTDPKAHDLKARDTWKQAQSLCFNF